MWTLIPRQALTPLQVQVQVRPIGVQQIRGVRSTEPMSRGGNDPAAVERPAVDVDHRLEVGDEPIAARGDDGTDRERVHGLGR